MTLAKYLTKIRPTLQKPQQREASLPLRDNGSSAITLPPNLPIITAINRYFYPGAMPKAHCGDAEGTLRDRQTRQNLVTLARSCPTDEKQ